MVAFKRLRRSSECQDVKPIHHLVTAVLVLIVLSMPAAPAAAQQPAETPDEKPAPAAAKQAEDSEPDAAERRAASSEFEREELDQAAFEEDEAQQAEETESSSSAGSGGSILRGVLGFAVVLASIYGVYWLLKKWTESRTNGTVGRTGIIDVVATTQLAHGRAVHLVRVGPEFVLVGATEHSITRLGEVSHETVQRVGGSAATGGEFQSMLVSAYEGDTASMGVEPPVFGADEQAPFITRFIDNLRLSTAR